MPMYEGIGEDEIHTVGQGNLSSLVASMQRSRAALPAAVQTPSWMKPGVPSGVSTPEEEMDFLPFDEQNNGGILDATHNELSFVALPQRPFRGERLIITAFSSTVSEPISNLVIDPAIYVGATQIGATQGKMSAAAFVSQAFGVRLSFPRAGQGTRIFVPLVGLIALTGTDKIAVSVGVIGRAVR